MAITPINIGTAPNDQTGDPFHTVCQKVNANEAYLDSRITAAAQGAVTSVSGRVGAVLLSSGDLTDSTSLGRSLLTATTASGALSALGGAPLVAPAFTGPASIASGSGASPTALSILPSTNATSRRASIQMDAWAFAQDLAANGTKDFGLYSAGYGGFALTFGATGAASFALSPAAPTPAAGDNSTKVATTAYADRAVSQASGVTTPSMPQGRLTLVSGSPVMSSAVSAATSVLYTPDRGNLAPIWNGSTFIMVAFAEVSQALSDASKSPAAASAGNVYDLFAWLDGSTFRVTRGPPWTSGSPSGSNTARGAGSGSTALTRVNGFLVNAVSIANGPAAGYGTYVGTIATDSTGATVSWNPGGISTGGTAAVFNVWNAYNRRPVMALVGDTTSQWSYASTTMRPANGSTAMRATFVIGSPEEPVEASYRTYATGGFLGVGFDSTSAYSQITGVAPGSGGIMDGFYRGPALGAHYLQALEWTGGGSATYSGQYYSALRFTASF